MTWKKKRPEAVPVAMESVRLLNCTPCLKLTDQVNEMLNAPAQRIKLPHHQRVTFAERLLCFDKCALSEPRFVAPGSDLV